MATAVAMETTGGAGKDGTPHRKPPTQRHGPSLELFPESCPPPGTDELTGPQQTCRLEANELSHGGHGEPRAQLRGGQGSGPGFPKPLPPQGYLKDKQLIGSRD